MQCRTGRQYRDKAQGDDLLFQRRLPTIAPALWITQSARRVEQVALHRAVGRSDILHVQHAAEALDRALYLRIDRKRIPEIKLHLAQIARHHTKLNRAL